MKELVRGISLKHTRTGIPIVRVHYTADPERDPATEKGKEWKNNERKKYTSQAAWDREQEIIYAAGGGERVFAATLIEHWDKIVISDPDFQAAPQWRRLPGFDWGKSNPTTLLETAINYDGTIYCLGEYYQPGLSPEQHCQLWRTEWPEVFSWPEIVADPSIFYKTQATKNGFRAYSDLFDDSGLHSLVPAPDNTEVTGMERILAHWQNLEEREPTLKIVCPTKYGSRPGDFQRKMFGVRRDGCPMLLWELLRTRREELSAVQLMRKNPSEQIVDKDNHLRDPLKYIVLSLPEPTAKSRAMLMQERLQGLDPTSAMIHASSIMAELDEEEEPITLGNRARFMGRRR